MTEADWIKIGFQGLFILLAFVFGIFVAYVIEAFRIRQQRQAYYESVKSELECNLKLIATEIREADNLMAALASQERPIINSGPLLQSFQRAMMDAYYQSGFAVKHLEPEDIYSISMAFEYFLSPRSQNTIQQYFALLNLWNDGDDEVAAGLGNAVNNIMKSLVTYVTSLQGIYDRKFSGDKLVL